jgi:hypothetical protein
VRDGVPEVQAGFRLVDQEYRMRATETKVLFALDAPVAFELGPALPHVLVGGDHGYEAPAPHDQGARYRVRSCVPSDPERRVLREPLEPEDAERFLGLPEGSGRTVDLAREVAGEGEPLERIRRLRAWLGANCRYTLLFVDRPRGNVIEDFLFETRAGHCEYFASALAVLLRAAGVPSRMVVGYRGGQWFEDGAFYLVRQSDAHAWVEAWVEDRGWTRVDPTPGDRDAVAIDPESIPGNIALTAEEPGPTVEEVLAAVRDFDAVDRGAVLKGVGSAFGFVVREGVGVGRKSRPFPPPLPVLAGAAILGAAFRRVRRSGFGRRERVREGAGAGRAPEPPRAPFNEEALAAISDRAPPRRSAQSPAEYEASVRERLGEHGEAFRWITRAFEAVRYGDRTLTEGEVVEVRALVRSLGPSQS